MHRARCVYGFHKFNEWRKRAHTDHRVWQDVYHVPCSAGLAYVKVTLQLGAVVIQFKEK